MCYFFEMIPEICIKWHWKYSCRMIKKKRTMVLCQHEPNHAEQLSQRKGDRPTCWWELYLGTKIVDSLNYYFLHSFLYLIILWHITCTIRKGDLLKRRSHTGHTEWVLSSWLSAIRNLGIWDLMREKKNKCRGCEKPFRGHGLILALTAVMVSWLYSSLQAQVV